MEVPIKKKKKKEKKALVNSFQQSQKVISRRDVAERAQDRSWGLHIQNRDHSNQSG